MNQYTIKNKTNYRTYTKPHYCSIVFKGFVLFLSLKGWKFRTLTNHLEKKKSKPKQTSPSRFTKAKENNGDRRPRYNPTAKPHWLVEFAESSGWCSPWPRRHWRSERRYGFLILAKWVKTEEVPLWGCFPSHCSLKGSHPMVYSLGMVPYFFLVIWKVVTRVPGFWSRALWYFRKGGSNPGSKKNGRNVFGYMMLYGS